MPGQGTKIPQAMQCGQIKKKKIIVKYPSRRIYHFNHFKVYNSMTQSAFLMVCHPLHHLVPELLHLS